MTPPNAGKHPASRRLRALAFGGGALDTIMQLGVVHALLVSQGREPDHVVGISAGAVNAAALAEILQAGESLHGEARRTKQTQSIAHGCATTLAAFHDSMTKHQAWMNAWGATRIDADPTAFDKSVDGRTLLKPRERTGGMCWFRINRQCPYSRQANEMLNKAIAAENGKRLVTEREIDELHNIYVECGKEETHKRR